MLATHGDWRRRLTTLQRTVEAHEALELSTARAEHELAEQRPELVPVREPIRQLCGTGQKRQL